jgi:uncharacterized protein (PEP-CTERM system associated)
MEANMARFSKTFLTAALGATALSTSAYAKTEVSPYIEIGQVLTTDVKGGDDSVLTYSTVAAGIDASVTNKRAEIQVSYRYERRFDYQKNVGDEDVHTGLARGRYDLVENTLSLEAGALAARTRSDIRGGAPIQGVGNVDNLTQVYSAYAGPSFATNVGPLDVAAAYRFGYTRVEAPKSIVLAPGQRPLDAYDDSKTHYATASVGMEAGSGVLPVGWLVSGGYEREDAGQLDQSYTSKYVRGDLTVPVTPTIAIVGGVGYETVSIKERDALFDGNGDPVIDAQGRFVTDPASPKRLAYDLDGIYWDAGVQWKPSARTMLEARVGRRYGTMSYTGSFSWQTGENSGIQLAAYDEVETFGQQVNDNLSQMPINFRSARNNGLGNSFSGCTFGGSFGGGCLGDAFQAATTAAYRSRGALAVYSAERGRWTSGFGIGYNQRKFLAPTTGAGISINGVRDQSWFAQGNMEYALSENSSFAADVYTELFNPGIAGAGNVISSGVTGSYYHQFGRKLSAAVSVGGYSEKVDDFESTINLSATAGLRYSF